MSNYPLRRLTPDQVKKVLSQRAVFVYVEKATGVPWQAVAAVWCRESLSVAPPKTPGGPFQFDPAPTRQKLIWLLSTYTNLPNKDIINMADKGVDDFTVGALACAGWLRHKVTPRITPDVSDAVIKDAFWGYNGRAYGSAEKSPYVMNGWDEARMEMMLTGTIPDKDRPGHRIEIKPRPEKRPGAFCVYKQLQALPV